MGLMWWLRLWLLLLLLPHSEFLLKCLFLPLSLNLLRGVPRPRGSVSLLPFPSRLLLPRRELLLWLLPKLRFPLLPHLLLSLPAILSQLYLRS